MINTFSFRNTFSVPMECNKSMVLRKSNFTEHTSRLGMSLPGSLAAWLLRFSGHSRSLVTPRATESVVEEGSAVGSHADEVTVLSQRNSHRHSEAQSARPGRHSC